MKKKKTNSLLALNYYWHDEKIDSSNDSLCVKKWYFGVQHLNESWVMPLEIFSVQICADEMVLILYKNTSGSARSMSTSSSAILMLVGLVLSNQLAWPGDSLARQALEAPQPRRGWPRGGSQGRWRPESQLREDSVGRNGQRSYGGPMVEGPPPQPADDAACVRIRVLGLTEEKLIGKVFCIEKYHQLHSPNWLKQ